MQLKLFFYRNKKNEAEFLRKKYVSPDLHYNIFDI